MLRLLSLTVFLGLLAGTVCAAETHPFSVHDMLAMDRISDPRVSPDGKLVAFTVSVTDLEANKRRNDIYLAAVDGSWVRRLTAHDASDTQPRWSPDGKSVYFVSTRSGSSQVWRIAVDGGEAEQVTSLPLDVDALEVAPDGELPGVLDGGLPRQDPRRDQGCPRREGEVEGHRDALRPAASSATGTPGRTARATTSSPIRCRPGRPAT